MLNLYRNSKLALAEAACTDGTSHQFRGCLDQASAINKNYDAQVAAAKSNVNYSKKDRIYKIQQIDAARNIKLRQLTDACVFK